MAYVRIIADDNNRWYRTENDPDEGPTRLYIGGAYTESEFAPEELTTEVHPDWGVGAVIERTLPYGTKITGTVRLTTDDGWLASRDYEVLFTPGDDPKMVRLIEPAPKRKREFKVGDTYTVDDLLDMPPGTIVKFESGALRFWTGAITLTPDGDEASTHAYLQDTYSGTVFTLEYLPTQA